MDKATRDDDFFTLFPTDDDDAAPTILVDTPAAVVPPPAAVPPPVTPIDVIQLSSDSGEENEGEVDWVTTEGESIADKVSARRRAHLASFGDVL